MQSALVASVPAVELAAELELFGRFVGEWLVRNALFSESTSAWHESDLVWTFDWIRVPDPSR